MQYSVCYMCRGQSKRKTSKFSFWLMETCSVYKGQASKQLPTSKCLCLECLRDPVWPLTALSEGHRSSTGSLSCLSSAHGCLKQRNSSSGIRHQRAGKWIKLWFYTLGLSVRDFDVKLFQPAINRRTSPRGYWNGVLVWIRSAFLKQIFELSQLTTPWFMLLP